MSMWEIGSEFHYHALSDNVGKTPSFAYAAEEAYVFSGRTAIETVLKHLDGARKAMLPSYCCSSMIEPFLSAGIDVAFYDVFWNSKLETEVKIDEDADLVLWCNYFGFAQKLPDFSTFIARGGILLEDITHSLLSPRLHHPQSHYAVASVRKWMPLISGGYCASFVGQLRHKSRQQVPDEFIDMKLSAMKQKSAYLAAGDELAKAQYLSDFSRSNHWLATNYSGLDIDPLSMDYLKSVDLEQIRTNRRENGKLIYEYLHAYPGASPIFLENEMECPLFVPIVFSERAERDATREKLISEKIYCPVHWPKPEYGCQSNLYDLELSLICDQRYSRDDIERMMQIICR